MLEQFRLQKSQQQNISSFGVCVCVNKIFMRPYLRAFHYKLRNERVSEWVGVWGNTFLMNAFIYGKISINYSFFDCLRCLRLFRKMWGKHKVDPLWPMFYYHHPPIDMWVSISDEIQSLWRVRSTLTSTASQFVWLNVLSILTKLKSNFHKSLLIFQFRVSSMDLIFILNRHIALCWLSFVCCL